MRQEKSLLISESGRIYQKYLFPVMTQIFLVCVITFFLEENGYMCGYGTYMGMTLIAIAGTSSALWACVYQKKYGGKKATDIVRDFFSVKTSIKSYCLVVIFLLLDFATVMVGGAMAVEKPYLFVLLFLKAILFGGIEEIGWRYTFQPALEKRYSYVIATLITSVCWGVWHFLFFYVDRSIMSVEVAPFAMGLLTNCFILSAIFRFSNSLWLCVMTHALINTFSQMTMGGNMLIDIAAKALIIITAISVSNRAEGKYDLS